MVCVITNIALFDLLRKKVGVHVYCVSVVVVSVVFAVSVVGGFFLRMRIMAAMRIIIIIIAAAM